MSGARGQASILLVGGLAGLLIGALVLGAVTRAVGREGAAQRAADLSALAAARAMREAYPRLFEPATAGGRPNPLHLDRAAYLALGRSAARSRYHCIIRSVSSVGRNAPWIRTGSD